jgi:hypothetical protein
MLCWSDAENKEQGGGGYFSKELNKKTIYSEDLTSEYYLKKKLDIEIVSYSEFQTPLKILN